MHRALTAAVIGLILGAGWAAAAGEADPLPKVRLERPRIFLRGKAWDGPSVEKIKSWMDREEYKAHWEKVERSFKTEEKRNINLALLWLLAGNREAGKQCLDRYKEQRSGGVSPSYWGITDQRMAACYDWLYDHPDFTPEMKKNRCEYLALRCQANMSYLKDERENPFYSRFSGALASLTACALAIHGDDPRAEEYLRYAYDCLRQRMSTIRRAEDGASGGGSYALHHEYTDLANLVACWRSATDWDAAKWIKDSQGDWLQRGLLWQIWMTYPSGQFVKDGDLWAMDQADDTQYRMSIDAVTGMYRNGYGRTMADRIYKRWGVKDYHSEYVWEFFVFNDPEVPAKPLDELGKAAVFAPDYQGVTAWRSSWADDAAIVHFRAGESGDTHATWDQGKFIIYKQKPLAIKNGAYIGFMSPQHKYYKSPFSANCVLFYTKEGEALKPALSYFPVFPYNSNNPLWPKGLFGWEEWKDLRAKTLADKREVMGRLVETEANDKFARALGDMSYRLRKGGGEAQTVWDWKRELVFLDYKYLLVLDRIKAGRDETGKEIVHAWTLHTTYEPKVEGSLVTADNGPARLFCRTLLPEKAKFTKVGGPGHECDFAGENPLAKDWTELNPAKFGPDTQMGAWRLDVTPETPAAESVYLHVLFPTDTKTEKMPECSVEAKGAEFVVKVGEAEYTFKPAK
ncbi:MAG TPA: hypothetical protein PK280_13360 [Planctomycetota bacterium]|nr:hypothetical protein [Planctomycetota bacterium]